MRYTSVGDRRVSNTTLFQFYVIEYCNAEYIAIAFLLV